MSHDIYMITTEMCYFRIPTASITSLLCIGLVGIVFCVLCLVWFGLVLIHFTSVKCCVEHDQTHQS